MKSIKRLVDTNLVQASGYGFDQFTNQAIEKIKDTIDCPNATIRFSRWNANQSGCY